VEGPGVGVVGGGRGGCSQDVLNKIRIKKEYIYIYIYIHTYIYMIVLDIFCHIKLRIVLSKSVRIVLEF
jgi:hypothetical protein